MQDRLPLAELVAEQRARLSLSLAAVARRMQDAADDEGTHCGATRQTIHEIERGRVPHPDPLRWLAVALELPVKQPADAARRQRMNRRQLLGGVAAVGGAMLLPAATAQDLTGRSRRSAAPCSSTTSSPAAWLDTTVTRCWTCRSCGAQPTGRTGCGKPPATPSSAPTCRRC